MSGRRVSAASQIDQEADALVAKYHLKGRGGTKCFVGESPHRELIEELQRRGMSDNHVAEAIIASKGTRYSGSTLQRHRRKLCQCQT